MARQKGASAVLALLAAVAGMLLLGLLLDLGHLAVQRTRLDAAVEAAARAVHRACPPGAAGCVDPVASQYLQANLPRAELEIATYDASGVHIRSYIVAPYYFGALWDMPPAILQSEFRLGLFP
jgi:Flp pilus assembly protein TadG